jgi:hypothetical protein
VENSTFFDHHLKKHDFWFFFKIAENAMFSNYAIEALAVLGSGVRVSYAP